MRAVDLILKKRDGGTLSREELGFLIQGYVRGEVPDYQMAAFLMAVCLRGMEPGEVADLTMAMVDSGDRMDLGSIPGIKVDKHSTGGVGDKTTLVLAPLVAAAGVPVAKMSGRGLGHSGGTLDKLESIPGLTVDVPPERFLEQVRRIGLAVVGQSRRLVPADGKMYALRDVTGTVDSLPLIASSIMSKKIGAGADAIVLDVKTGRGAFMKDFESALTLARTMVDIGERAGRRTRALITGMDQALGHAVGNALELREAVATLAGGGPADLRELCLVLGSHMLVLGGVAQDLAQARSRLEELLESGAALARLQAMVEAQGGDPRAVLAPGVSGRADAGVRDGDLLPVARYVHLLPADVDGYVTRVDALLVGRAAMLLGAGRARKEDRVDPAVGIVLRRKVGDPVRRGEPLAEVHYNDADRLPAALELLEHAYRIEGQRPPVPPLILALVTAQGVEHYRAGPQRARPGCGAGLTKGDVGRE
ncbi:MAG: pyrimidine-nucleoside phosphorylase [Bacillota bacterium]